MKCKCGNTIPAARIEYGYKECVQCSTTEAHGCIDIIYHKTGNTIQITDRQTAEKMRQLSRRSGFGTLRGMGAGKTETHKTTIKKGANNIVTRSFIPDNETFDKVGEEALILMETEGYDVALKFLQKKVADLWISPMQLSKIKVILNAMLPVEKNEPKQQREWYSKYEPKSDKKEISDEIAAAFTYWK
jgi:predicted negative regulator of RcsB-dependent stress response